MVIWHLKQIGKVKKLDKWVPHELTTNKKMPFWSVVFSYSTHTQKTNHFFVGLWCVTKSGFYTTTGNDQLSGWTDKLQSTSQSQNCTKKKVIVTVWWSAAHLIHYSFLSAVKPVHLRSMLSRFMRCTENCSACSRCWSREMAKFFFKTVPGCMSYNQSFKSWMNWAVKFCFICHSHLSDLSPTD